MATSIREKVAERQVAKNRGTLLFVLGTLLVLLANQFLSFHSPPTNIFPTSSEYIGMKERKTETHLTPKKIVARISKEREAPIWSAYRRQHANDVAAFDAIINWHFVGVKEGLRPKRYATEVLTYGLAGVFPWYGYSLPAIKFDSPFTNMTQVDHIRVGGVVDAFLDLHQCRTGRPNETGRTPPDGYYDSCFPNVTGRGKAKRLCFAKDHKYMQEKTRLHHYPAKGHKRWSCYDNQVLEQLAAFQVLDYIIAHKDRFWKDRTNNIFFSLNHEPITFVNIDHDTHICDFFKKRTQWMEYDRWVVMDMLKDYQLPSQLRDELRSVVSGSKEAFVKKLNATIDGQLDGVARVLEEVFAQDCPTKEMLKPTVDMIWDRIESVARFYDLVNYTSDK